MQFKHYNALQSILQCIAGLLRSDKPTILKLVISEHILCHIPYRICLIFMLLSVKHADVL